MDIGLTFISVILYVSCLTVLRHISKPNRSRSRSASNSRFINFQTSYSAVYRSLTNDLVKWCPIKVLDEDEAHCQ